MSTRETPVRIGQSLEALDEFVEAMHVAEDAVRNLRSLLLDDLDRQVFETIQDLITHAASAVWDAHPHAGQFIEDAIYGAEEER